MASRGAYLLIVGLLVAGLAACTERRPPPSQPATPAPRQEAPAPRQEAPAAKPAPRAKAILFIHEPDFPLSGCRRVGEAEAGAESRPGQGDERWRGSTALLELAIRAQSLGGNVVVLPRFSEEFTQGRVTGHIYRCGTAQREALYRRASSEQRLTVIEP